MKKMTYFKETTLFVVMVILFSCSTATDINNEKAIMKDIQGVWIGCENIGNMYRHIKFSVANDIFEAWVQTSDSQNEPTWAPLPDEKGGISVSSLQNDEKSNQKFRKFAFICSGRCCGDKSFCIKTIADLISYEETTGLTLDHKIKMTKKINKIITIKQVI